MTREVNTYIIRDDDREMFLIIMLDNKEEIHVTIDKQGENHHTYRIKRDMIKKSNI